MNFPYAIKGCSHCDSREDCPIELKRSQENLLEKPKTITEAFHSWVSYCAEFFRVYRSVA